MFTDKQSKELETLADEVFKIPLDKSKIDLGIGTQPETLWDKIEFHPIVVFFYRRWEDCKDIIRSTERWWSRRTKGYDELDLWSYSYQFFRREYKPFCAYYESVTSNKNWGWPASVKSEKEWIKILDEIKYAMDFFYDEHIGDGLANPMWDDGTGNLDVKKYEIAFNRANKGMKLFGEYLICMWD